MIKKIVTSILCVSSFMFLFNVTATVHAQKEKELVALMKQLKVPGVQIIYQKNGNNISYNLGEKKHGSGDKVTANTLFQVASMTKSVAAYAALKLIDKKVLDLDTPLSDYWEYDRLKDDFNAKSITARMVLNHTSGLPNWAKKKPLKTSFKPGVAYRYSGEGFYYLQQVMEYLTGKSLEVIIREEVFIPFGMENSSLLYHKEKNGMYAYGHRGTDGLKPTKLRKFTKANAAYTMLSTATDYTKFVKNGILEGKGLKKETHKLMLSTSSLLKPKNQKTKKAYKHLSYGLGVLLQENELGKKILHGGANGRQFYSIFVADPSKNESLVILTNGANGKKFREKAIEILLPKQIFWMFRR